MMNVFSSISSREILELLLLASSLAVHILDAKQKLLSRILWFPHLILNMYLFSQKKLYGKVFYSVVTLFINAYAYIQWKDTKKAKPIQVSKTDSSTLFLGIAASLVLSMPWTIFRIRTTTDISAIAIYFDALYAVLGLFEKFLMSKKRLERWILACLRYIFATITMIKTHSPILAVQHIILVIISIYGQCQWYISYKKHEHCHTSQAS